MILAKLIGSVLGQPTRPASDELTATPLEQGETALKRRDADAAAEAFQTALSLAPADARIHHRIGAAYIEAGMHADAERHLAMCVALDPGLSRPYALLGSLHQLRGDIARAEKRYREALERDADSFPAHYNLAVLLRGQGRMREALRHFIPAHAIAPLQRDMLRQFVAALLECDEYDRAAEIAGQAAHSDPATYEGWFCLGLARHKQHRYLEALECYDKALALDKDDVDLRTHRAMVLHELGRMPEALAGYDAALALRPGDPLARFHKSLALLLNGNFASAWPDYETRLRSHDVPRRVHHYPRWEGSAVAGRTILIYGEQGLGDEIMFAACLPDLIRSGARCVIECNAGLHSIFSYSFPEATVYAAASDRQIPDAIRALDIDCEVPIGSLAMHYRARAADFPRHEGYLKVAPERVFEWRARLAALGPGPTIGISWRGGTHKSRSPLRSIELARWLPIFRIPGIHLVSLQYGAAAPAELDALMRDHGVRITHWPGAIVDYEDTAALVSALDLTITVCTSIVHLAGALGRPVWVMAPYIPEWRYGRSGETLPWYPSARMFRQNERGQWQKVIDTVASELGSYSR